DSAEDNIVICELDYEAIQFRKAEMAKEAPEEDPMGLADYCEEIEIDKLPLSSIEATDTDENFLKEVEKKNLLRKYSSTPFATFETEELNSSAFRIFYFQSLALQRRLSCTASEKIVIGISGGLDSTLALLVCVNAHIFLQKPLEDIIAITMPGFGTGGESYKNAVDLAKSTGVTLREISIKDSVNQHFKDIGQDPKNLDITYENAQARERTQILMDVANMEKGIVIGTGDLSELALGWCTYNGDQMSMYSVNCGIPKTVIPSVIKEALLYFDAVNEIGIIADMKTLKKVCKRVIEQPISPELIPQKKKGEMIQKTEDIVGPYELHDFFLYHTLKFGTKPEKLLLIAVKTFCTSNSKSEVNNNSEFIVKASREYSSQEILKWLRVFYKRFFAAQFKRNPMPDGPRIYDFSLSPKDFNIPSDLDVDSWI
ncbi:MAG: NAD(+) synthase, partial [Anaerovoracaceae bacterium]